MKDIFYVYEIVFYFRSLINGIDKEENIDKLFNRGYLKGYFYDNDKIIMNRDYLYNMGEKIGEVVGKSIRVDEDIVLGDGIIFVLKDYKNFGGIYINKIVYKNEKLVLNFLERIKYIFRNYNKRLNDEILKKIKNIDKKLEINFDFIVKLNEKLILKIYLEDENKNRILDLEEIFEILI